MFYDERIEAVKGRVARRAIVISLFVSLLLGGTSFVNILRNSPDPKYLWYVAPDIAILVGAIVVLAIGALRGLICARDERGESEQNKFYNKAARAMIILAFGALSYTLPVVLSIGRPIGFAVSGIGTIVYVLAFTVGAYVVCSFRRNDICFNYSIIDSDRYYVGVFKNIGRLALYALALLGISAISFTIRAMVIGSSERLAWVLIETVVCHLLTFAVLAVLYLLYSYLEKCSYDKEDSISRSTVVSLWITIIIYAVYTAAVIWIDRLPISQANAVGIASTLSSLDIYIRLALLVFLTYFGYEYQRVRKNRLLSAACNTLILSEVLAVLVGQVVSGLILIFMPEILKQESHVISSIFSTASVAVGDAQSIASAVGILLIVFALVGDGVIGRANRLAVFAVAVLGGVEIFLRTQVDVLTVNIYHFIAELILLFYLAVLVARLAQSSRGDRADRF